MPLLPTTTTTIPTTTTSTVPTTIAAAAIATTILSLRHLRPFRSINSRIPINAKLCYEISTARRFALLPSHFSFIIIIISIII